MVFHTYGTYCTIQLCGCVRFGSGGKSVLVVHTYVLRVQYNCGVVLVFWSSREIVIDFTYVFSVQYSCAVVSVFWSWWEIVLKMRTRFYKKSYWVTLLWFDSRCVYLLDQTLFYSVSFYFGYFSLVPHRFANWSSNQNII